MTAQSWDLNNESLKLRPILFSGDWASKFDVNNTKRDNFYINREKIAMTKFMTQKGKNYKIVLLNWTAILS